MTKIQGITDYANQLFTLALPNGETFELTLMFSPLQIGWFCGVKYGDNFQVDSLRVTTVYNILEQWSEIIPFGLACFTTQNQEPNFAQDFQSGAAALCILTQEEMLALKDFYAD